MAHDRSSPTPSDDGGNGTVVSSIHSKQQENVINNDDDDMQQQQSKRSFFTNLPPWVKKLHLGIVYFGLFVTMLMIALQATVIAPAMTKIATDMDDVGNQTWVATAYLIGMISLQPLAGKVLNHPFFVWAPSNRLTIMYISSFPTFLEESQWS